MLTNRAVQTYAEPRDKKKTKKKQTKKRRSPSRPRPVRRFWSPGLLGKNNDNLTFSN